MLIGTLGTVMTFKKTLVVAAAATFVTASTAQAQHRGGGGHSGGSGHATPRSAAPRSSSGVAPRAPGAVVGTAAPRAYGTLVRPYGYGGSGVFRGPVTFYRPYYFFRPRLNIGFGLWAGFPIAYPYYWGYYDPFYAPYSYGYPYPYPYVSNGYPYPTPSYPAGSSSYPPSSSSYPPSSYPQQSGSIGVQTPNESDMGGVSFEITPATAEIFVDGQRAGTVNQFTPTSQPIGLTAGRHRIEIRAPGYKSMDFDVDIVAGQVIPYQGTLEQQ
jgi:hypothetical protein